MNLSLKIARRYLFAKKTTNAINIITSISVFGIAVGTAALVLVLSVFNGFEDLIVSMYGNFNPDVKILPAKGKTFDIDSMMLNKLYRIQGVELISQTLEETAFFEYKGSQDVGIVKGIDVFYQDVTHIDSTVREGSFKLQERLEPAGEFRILDGTETNNSSEIPVREWAVLGLGMRNKLQVNVGDLFTSMTVYMPKSKEVGMFEQQFRRLSVQPAGTFVIQQEFNNQYVLTSLDFARELLGVTNAVSALEIKLSDNATQSQVMNAIRQVMGPDFVVKNRFEQEESFLKLMQVEKWLSFAIASLMLLLVTFNMVGALWMVVLEKQKDISILKSMGATDTMVRNIFLNEGLLLCLFGVGIGFALALVIYGAQKSFGLVGMPGNFMIEAYPISMRWIDFMVVAITVIAIGLLASIPPALRAKRVPTIIREE